MAGVGWIAKRATAVLRSVREGSVALNRETTRTVGGVFGGAIGLAVAYILTIAQPALSLWFLGPVLCAAGIAAGHLGLRGPEVRDTEDIEDAKRLQAEAIREQIRQLEHEQAPQRVIDAMWDRYVEVSTGRMAQRALPPPTQGE